MIEQPESEASPRLGAATLAGESQPETAAAAGIRRLIVTAHGIQAHGQWQVRLQRLLEKAEPNNEFKFRHLNYGFFSFLQYAIPPLRFLKVRWCEAKLKKLIVGRNWDRIDIIGHSFGTHLIAYSLLRLSKKASFKVHTLIFAGSVLRYNFPWDDLLDTTDLGGTDGCVHRLVNECGQDDFVLLVNQLLIFLTGSAGRFGFAGDLNENFCNRYYPFGHSGYFEAAAGSADADPSSFMAENWMPLLLKDETLKVPEHPPGGPLRNAMDWVFRNLEPIKLFMLLSPLLVILWVIIGQRNRAHQLLEQASQGAYATAQELFGNGEWRKGVAYLGRALDFSPTNQSAANYLLSAIQLGGGDRDRLPFFAVDHTGPVNDADFSPDGQYFVTASNDGTARIWETATGKWGTHNPLEHGRAGDSRGRQVWCARFSPDGKKIVTTAADGRARIWDASTGALLFEMVAATLQDGDAEATTVETGVFSPDGRIILTAAWDNTARLFNTGTGEEILPRLEHRSRVAAAVFSPNGKRIATACWDGTAQVWDVTTHRKIGYPIEHGDVVVRRVAFSPDSKRVVKAALDNTVRICDAESGLVVSGPLPHDGLAWTVAISSDGKLIATASHGKTAQLWRLEGGTRLGDPLIHGGAVESVAFSKDGLRLVTASSDRYVRMWDTRTGKLLSEPFHHDDSVLGALFSPDASRVLSFGLDNGAYVWSTTPRRESGKILDIGAPVLAVECTPDPDLILLALGDGTAGIWSVPKASFEGRPVPHGDTITATAVCRTQSVFVTGGEDGIARVWDRNTGTSRGQTPRLPGPIYGIVFSVDGKSFFTADSSGYVNRWDTADAGSVGAPWHATPRETFAIAADSATGIIAAGGRNSEVRFLLPTLSSPLTTKWKLSDIEIPGGLKLQDAVLALSFGQDGKTLATGSVDNAIRLWSLSTGKQIGTPVFLRGQVNCIRHSAKGERLLISSRKDRNVYCLEAATGWRVCEPLRHSSGVRHVAVSDDGSRIFTVDDKGSLRVWQLPKASLPPPPWLSDFVRASAGVTFLKEQHAIFVPMRERLRLRDAGRGISRTESFLDRLEALIGLGTKADRELPSVWEVTTDGTL